MTDERVELVRRNLKPGAEIPVTWVLELIEAYDELDLATRPVVCKTDDHNWKQAGSVWVCDKCGSVYL